MSSLLIAAVAAALVSTSPTLTLAQNATPAPQAPPTTAPSTAPAPIATIPPGPAATGIPVLPPATEVADCAQLLRSPAYCVTAPLGQVGALAEAYIEHLKSQNWLAADGDDNRVIFVRRREGGGCDGMQMIAFYDHSKPAEETAPGYLGFAVIPGDICAAAPAATPAPGGAA